MSQYYTKEELQNFLDTTHESHMIIEELDRLRKVKINFKLAMDDVEEKHQYIIADCLDDVTYKIEMIHQKLEAMQA
jgi:hypothetical protein